MKGTVTLLMLIEDLSPYSTTKSRDILFLTTTQMLAGGLALPFVTYLVTLNLFMP